MSRWYAVIFALVAMFSLTFLIGVNIGIGAKDTTVESRLRGQVELLQQALAYTNAELSACVAALGGDDE